MINDQCELIKNKKREILQKSRIFYLYSSSGASI